MEFRFLLKALIFTFSFIFSVAAMAATNPTPDPSLTSQIEVGKHDFNQGRYEDALAAWNVALDKYRSLEDKSGQAKYFSIKQKPTSQSVNTTKQPVISKQH